MPEAPCASAKADPVRKTLMIAASVCAALTAAPACADTDHNSQAWLAVNTVRTLSERFDATLELHTRVDDSLTGLTQLLVRPSLTYKLRPSLTLTAGYLFFRHDPETGQTTNEHRIWEQIGYTIAQKDGGLRVTGRTRLEQRFTNNGGTGWRIRQQTRIDAPFHATSKVNAVVWNETFFGLNDTNWGARAGFDQTRTFVGINLPLTGKVRLEPGYLNQFIARRGPNVMNHVVAVNFNVKL